MDPLDYITKKFNIDTSNNHQRIFDIPNTGRETLAELFKELGYKTGAEIGVERGKYSAILLEKNPELLLYCIDAWLPYKGYRDHVTQEKMDMLLSEAEANLAPYADEKDPNKNRFVICRDFSMDAVKDFKDESLDFVYIDANHEYQQVVNDICEWQKKVKVGGIIAGHDYIRRTQNGYLMHVIEALHGYIESYKIRPVFVLGRKEHVEGELRDKPRSWFFVKTDNVKIKTALRQS